MIISNSFALIRLPATARGELYQSYNNRQGKSILVQNGIMVAMRLILISISILLIVLAACQIAAPEDNPIMTFTDTSTTEVVPTSTLPASSTTTLIPSITPTTSPTTTRSPVPPTPTTSPTIETNLFPFEVRTHPDGGLFVGDQVSFEVIAPPDFDLDDGVLSISDTSSDGLLLEAQFAPFGIGGRNQATLYWEWDTTELDPGTYPLSFSIDTLGYTWTHTVTLDSAAQIPPPESAAVWSTDESDCCVFYYITETAAAREITATLQTADELADQVANTFNIDFTEPLVVTLMPRVLGQGGFASSEIYISFLDRNYAGNSFDMVLNHEMAHILDYRLGGEMRPTILIEGLAVYLSGGHYKPEALIPRAAALLQPSNREDGLGLGWYLPLKPLINDFYNSQHEIGYIQAGALVEYMINTWGWEAYSAFYRDINPIQNGSQADAMDAALLAHFDINLESLERKFLDMLRVQEITPETMDDVRLTVEFFDAMRRYQQILDPSAYFLTAWLPNGPLMREKGIVADLTRRPSELENIVLETLLVGANDALIAGDYTLTKNALSAVDLVLGAIEIGQTDPFDVHPLAKSHYQIALQLQESGFQVERIAIDDGKALVTASQGWSDLIHFEFALAGDSWALVSSQ